MAYVIANASGKRVIAAKGKKLKVNCFSKSLLLTFLLAPSLFAQTSDRAPRVSTVFAILTSSLEAKRVTVDQQFVLKTISDVVVDGELVIPKGTRVVGHVTDIATRGKDQTQSELWLVIDKAVRKDGREIPLQAIIAAIASPRNSSLTDDPTYGMMHSNEPTQSSAKPASVTSGGALPAASKVESTAAVATANLKGRMDERATLDENSQGSVGYDDLSLSWHLMVPPPITVFASKRKNIQLRTGTQMLLRMALPRIPR
jgi:hypothetical protein